MSDAVLSRLEDRVLTLTLNRPRSLNSFDAEMRPALADAIARAAEDDGVRALVLTGTGRGFCAGANVKEFFASFAEDALEPPVEFVRRSMEQAYNPIIEAIVTMPKPVLASVNGVCAGGGASLALCCDVVLAARSAVFQQTFLPKLGIIPDLGATWTVPRLVGRGRALAWALSGDPLDAQTAQSWGLVFKTFDDDALASETAALALRLADLDPDAVGTLKRVFQLSGQNDLQTQLATEVREQLALCARPAFAEGVARFAGKR